MNENRNLNCLYNVYLNPGMVRLTDREATAEYGPEFIEHADHSEWCREHGPYEDSNPPF